MPTAQEILAGLERLAVDWRGLAILWHLYFGLLLAAALSGVRATRRLWGAALALPTASVSTLAWAAGPPPTICFG